MKPLNNYIVERIRVDNIKHTEHTEFPAGKVTMDKTIGFLEKMGFNNIPHVPSRRLEDVVEIFNDTHGRCFTVSINPHQGDKYILFTNTSNDKISIKNPMYCIVFYNKDPNIYIQTTGDIKTDVSLTEDKFRTKMKYYFD